MKADLHKHLMLLDASNFTPLARTPWAGKEIASEYKKNFNPNSQKLIGESWEYSCSKDFPSKVVDSSQSKPLLRDLIDKNPEEILSKKQIELFGPKCNILVKLLNAMDYLSVQVHPSDSYEKLHQDECGKPESWLVLDAKPGCGLYIGFKEKTSKKQLSDALKADDLSMKNLLQFVEVQPGDYFEITAGTVHAIGPGVTLVEPQVVQFGKNGKTYRLWDWNRKYDTEGNRSNSGKPRELHIENGLDVIDPSKQFGSGFIQKIKKSANTFLPAKGVKMSSFSSNGFYQTNVIDVEPNTSFDVEIRDGYGILLNLEGKSAATNKSSTAVELKKGQPALIPASATKTHFQTNEACRYALILPDQAQLTLY